MSEFPSLPLFTDAYLADTRHLSAQEHGAYLLLLMMAWRMPDCRLPDDDTKLAKWASVDGRTWKRIKPTVMAFWTLAEDQWSQSRLVREREYVSKRAEVARANGAKGGRPKPLNPNGSENPAGSTRVTQPKAPNPSPKPTVIEPIAQQPNAARSEGLFDKLCDAAGIKGNPHPGLVNLAIIIGMLNGGFDLERDVLAGIRAKPKPDVRTWGYFEGQIREYVAKRDGAAALPKQAPPQEDWSKRMAVWNESRTWAAAWGPKPDEPKCRVPAELLKHAA